jgi:hypothetical protein
METVLEIENVDKDVLALASLLHKKWQEEFKRNNPGVLIKVKVFGSVIDSDGKESVRWVNATDVDSGKVNVTNEIKRQDILNTDFSDLDPYWQKDNTEAAKVAVRLVRQAIESRRDISDLSSDTGWIEEAASEVHKEWSLRNRWDQKASMDYKDLSREEQEKDVLHIRLALEVLSQ